VSGNFALVDIDPGQDPELFEEASSLLLALGSGGPYDAEGNVTVEFLGQANFGSNADPTPGPAEDVAQPEDPDFVEFVGVNGATGHSFLITFSRAYLDDLAAPYHSDGASGDNGPGTSENVLGAFGGIQPASAPRELKLTTEPTEPVPAWSYEFDSRQRTYGVNASA